MCGFSGILSSTNFSSEVIIKSIKSIQHRGKNDTLIFEENTQSFYATTFSSQFTKSNFQQVNDLKSNGWFAFNRLSIVDLSNDAMQPFYDKNSDWIFMLNGEIYNYKELKNKYLDDIHFNSSSDAEVAFRLFLLKGNDFINELNGMFSIVLYNIQNKELRVWRDRLGIKPFYYTFLNDTFIFSSEIKGILFTELVNKEIDYQNLAYSMYLGTCPNPKTIYKNIFSLEAGSFLSFSFENEIKIQRYWNLTFNEDKTEISNIELKNDIINLCKLYDTSELQKSIMLSGGFDSGILTYFLSKTNKNYKAFHLVNFDESELEFAKLNAENSKIDLINLYVNESLKDNFQNYQTIEEEPNSTLEPTLLLCEEISKHKIKIVYNALGIDEIFGGYAYYQKVSRLNYFHWIFKWIPQFLVPEKYKELFKTIQQFGLISLAFHPRTIFSWNEINLFLKDKNVETPQHPIEFLLEQIYQIYPEFKKLPILKKISYLDVFYLISSHHSLRSDLPSMNYGLEMRLPFLEHTFLEKYFNKTSIFDGINQYLKPKFREFAKDFLPEKVINMQKKGFNINSFYFYKHQGLNEKQASQKWYKDSLTKIFTK